jgi:putative aldouronate transport system permease protein
MWGLLIAFKDYSPFLGFFHSKWIGFANFKQFFTDGIFILLLKNTLYIAILNIVFYFPLPIIVALLLNEVRKEKFKKIIQTLVYIPHFFSWVVIVGLTFIFLNADDGLINSIIRSSGGQSVSFLMNPSLFRPLITLQVIWKECGWGTIIFLAALSGVDISLYEAAIIDGADRWKQMWHITLPAIRSTIVILLILRLGAFLDTGFEQLILMVNPMTREVGEVFDTYVYTNGVQQGNFSFTTAVGLFKSVVGLILIFTANKFASKFGEEGIF